MKRSPEQHLFREVERLSITVVTDNYYDALRPDTAISKSYRTRPGRSMHAEHGLSYFVETVTPSGDSGALMFDYGVDARGVSNNIRLLEIDLSRINAFGLSHGHFDHWGGFIGILKRGRKKIAGGTPLFLGVDAFAHRYSVRPSEGIAQDLGRLKREEIESLGIVRIVEVTEPTELIPGGYFTGPIERVTPYEHVRPTLKIKRNGVLEQDQFPGEQAVVFLVRGKGLVVLSGCAHVGIVNTVMHARKMTDVDRVHAVVGGFHLVGSDSEAIDATVADIKRLSPDHVIPTHCTGFEAINRFREEMADQFHLNTAGTTYTFQA
jgi:7,8-dihydropterin-6-yl-methyl-4-(beta-D-ribofuranosyl)aminobenzene 5'-phosphate synthase